ncbi:hypothetical protein C7212DRAFT_232397 [Tuber magnatum]|uniref:Uncharacterized protein n=1 Tax=Tuber magnatum TaxID=42249 RepID=A0A317SDJ4_9PEZI|nr:hypothetical protein C7212DRAFT_232397 [Tuber magnatum]
MARRKAVTAVEKDEEVRVTRSTRSRAAQAAQQAPPSIPPPPPPPPPAPRGRTAAKSASRKRKSSVSSDEDDELATKKANIRTSSSPPPTVNRGRKAAIKNARGRRKVITSPTVSGSNTLGDEMDVEEPENVELPPVVEAEHESGKNLPMGEGRENVEVEAEVKKPKKARKAPAKRRGAQKKVAVPDSGIRKGRKPGRKFDGSQIEVEPEMSATDDADDGEASALTSSMLTEDKTDTPPSSFLVQEDSNMATKGVGAQVEEPEKVKRTPARKRGAKKMEVASDPAEPKVEASEETTAANVEKPKAKRGRKPGPKATRKGGRKPPAVKAEAEEEASIEGSNVEVGVQEGSLERVGAEGTTADNNIISGAGLQGEKDGEIGVSEAPADRVSVEETITNANADIEVTKAGEARVEESEADAAATKEVVLEETAVGVAILDESAIREFTVESTAFDKAPEIELPIVEEEAKAEEVGVEGLGLALAETGGVVIGEPVVGETALEHLAVEDAIIDKSIEIEATRAEEAQMVEKIVEDVSVEVVGSRDSNAEKTIAEDTTLEPKAPKSGVFEAVEEEVAIQQLTRPDAGGAVEDLVDDTTAPGGILAESAGDETNATTNIAAEPVADDTIGNIATAQAEGGVPGKVREDEEGQLSTEGSAKDPGKSSPTVVDAVGSDIRAEIEDGCHALPSFKRKARGRLSEPAGGKVADFVKMDASHKRQSTGGGLPLPKRRRVTPPPMQPPSTPAAIAPSPRKVASPSAESTPRSTGTLATPVKPLGPFLMPPATPEAVAGFGRSPTKGSAPLGLVCMSYFLFSTIVFLSFFLTNITALVDDGDDDDGGDDGGDEAMVATTEGARRWGREMAQRHLQQYQGVFEKLRGDFEISEGFQQAYQGVMRRAFTPGKPSPGRARLSPSSSTLLAFEGHGLDDGDDSFDRSFNRAVSPDRSSVVWAWDIEHEGAWNQKAEGGSDGADDEDGAKEAIANPLNVEEKV